MGELQTEPFQFMRIPDHLEHRFRANVNTNSGKLNTDSGEVEHRFRGS